jgi:hypothetical protein
MQRGFFLDALRCFWKATAGRSAAVYVRLARFTIVEFGMEANGGTGPPQSIYTIGNLQPSRRMKYDSAVTEVG